MWQLRMLGRFEVSKGGVPATFRSRKVGALLAFLALNKGRAVSNHTLQELLWPDSDGDRQGQSLRRAVADLRDALATAEDRDTIVRTEAGKVQLDPEAFESDFERFGSQLASAAADSTADVADALTLYGGPLLAPVEDDWVLAYRRQAEEMYCGAVESLGRHLVESGQGREAARLAHASTLLAPLREEPYVIAILAYMSLGNQGAALQQFEALESMLADEFGQTPSAEALAALNAPQRAPTQPTSSEPQPTGGAVPAESHFYIERVADGIVDHALQDREAVVLVFGPRQTGKTSLLARAAQRVREGGSSVVVTDFQALGTSEIERSTTLYRALIHSFASQLGLEYEPSWNEWVGPNSNLDAKVEALLRQVESPVCWAMDEVDRVFTTGYADDFFGLIRSWHNRRALQPDGPWKRFSVLISYATEAQMFITDLNQSPFNVGVRVNLRDFTQAEVVALGRPFGLSDPSILKRVFALLKGHPFLTRRAFAALERGVSLEELEVTAHEADGPFGEHLRHLRDTALRDAGTQRHVQELLAGGAIVEPEARYRLWASGLLSGTSEGAGFRVPVYETFLRAML